MGLFSSKKPKMKIHRYYMSLHVGICHGPVDEILGIEIKEKQAWSGRITQNGVIGISKEDLFGGDKKEGGVRGVVEVLFGRPDQKLSNGLARRLRMGDSDQTPGFRGLTSLFFRGHNRFDTGFGRLFGGIYWSVLSELFGSTQTGFYWGANNPYIPDVWVKVRRIPRQLDPETAVVYRTGGRHVQIYFQLDDSGSMAGTRMTVMKKAMSQVLDNIEAAISAGQHIGLGISTFNSGYLEFENVTPTQLNELRSFVSGLTAGGSTDFQSAIKPAVRFFTEHALDASISHRVNIFVTDGEPSPVESAAAAEREAQLLLSRTIPVDMYGINIDLTNTEYTAMLDNTASDGVPVVTGDDPSGLLNAVMSALMNGVDANPAHVIYECLTDTDWGMGASTDTIDVEAFQAVARTLYNENFGIFMQWHQGSRIEDFINQILEHIKGSIFTDPRSGKTSIRLLRDDYEVDGLRTIGPGNAKLSSFSRKGWGETANEMVVTWTNPENEKEETVYAQDLGNIALQGGIVSDSRNYFGVRSAALAKRLAERELRSSSAPLCSCEATVTRDFWDVTPLECVKLDWPEYGIQGMVMRVIKVDYGRTGSSEIKLSLVEDVFSLPLATFVSPAEGIPVVVSAPPLPVSDAAIFPVPPLLLRSFGEEEDPADLEPADTRVTILAASPVPDTVQATYQVHALLSDPIEGELWDEIGEERPFLGRGSLPADLPAAANSVLQGLTGFSGVLAQNQFLIIGSPEIPAREMELCFIASTDDDTGEVVVLRGALDTVPRDWPEGTFVWVAEGEQLEALPIEYVDGETASVQLVTITPEGRTPIEVTPVLSAEAQARPTLPARPSNVRVNGTGFGEVEAADGMVHLTWAHRNRLTETSVRSWDAASVTPETGTTYIVESDAYGIDGTRLQEAWFRQDVGLVDQFVLDTTVNTPPPGTQKIAVRVIAARDGLESWQAHEILVTLKPAVTVRITEDGNERVTEDGQTRAMEG